jgi:hypothetical protein
MGAVGAAIAVPIATAGITAGISSASGGGGKQTSTSTTVDPLAEYRSIGLSNIQGILGNILSGNPRDVLSQYTSLNPATAGYPQLTGTSQDILSSMNSILGGGMLTDIDSLRNRVAASQLFQSPDYYMNPEATNAITGAFINAPAQSNMADLTSFINAIGGTPSLAGRGLMSGSINDVLSDQLSRYGLDVNNILANRQVQDTNDYLSAMKTANQVKMAAANSLQAGAGASGLMNMIKSWGNLAAVPRTQAYAEKIDPYNLKQRLLEAYQGALNIPSMGSTSTSTSTTPSPSFGSMFAANAITGLGNSLGNLLSNWTPSIQTPTTPINIESPYSWGSLAGQQW